MHPQGPPSPSDFARQARFAFEQAVQRVGLVQRFYAIAGQQIVLHFAGEALIPALTPALEHLRCPPCDQPTLSVLLFDSESTQTPMPAPPWNRDNYGPNGQVHGFNTDDVHTVYNTDTGILNVMDRSAQIAVFWIRRPGSIPYWETAAPLRTVLHWAMRDGATQLVHGAAVGYSSGGVLIAAKGGSGKSTSTLCCLASDLLFAGDDYVAVEGRGTPFVHSLYQTAKLNADDVSRIDHLGLKPVNSNQLQNGTKAVFFPAAVYPCHISRGFPLRCIFIPRVSGRRETVIRPARQAEALLSLAPTTLYQLPGSYPQAFEKMRTLVRELPTYHFEAGLEVAEIPRVIGDFLRREFV
jgi:hypothetical protein